MCATTNTEKKVIQSLERAVRSPSHSIRYQRKCKREKCENFIFKLKKQLSVRLHRREQRERRVCAILSDSFACSVAYTQTE